jgi:hypothetical protein
VPPQLVPGGAKKHRSEPFGHWQRQKRPPEGAQRPGAAHSQSGDGPASIKTARLGFGSRRSDALFCGTGPEDGRLICMTAERVARPTAIRLTEVMNAVLRAIDERDIKPGQTVRFIDVETALDAAGYPARWVPRAVETLVEQGRLQDARTTELLVISTETISVRRRKLAIRSGRRSSLNR